MFGSAVPTSPRAYTANIAYSNIVNLVPISGPWVHPGPHIVSLSVLVKLKTYTKFKKHLTVGINLIPGTYLRRQL